MTKPNVIEMHDITKKFGEFVANDHINLDVRQGEIHALLGENGAGKSTLFNAITGNIVPNMGTIAFNNTVINKKRPDQICHLGISRTFQNIRLFGQMTVEEINGLDLVYAPAVAPVYDPILIAASQAMKKVEG